MYGWGPEDVKTWKKPKGYDYGSAEAPYLKKLKEEADEKGPRSYLVKSKPKLELVNPLGKNLYTESENPVIIAVDGTGSMQTWPKEIHDRIPLMYQTLSKYKSDFELSLSVIGDAISDSWALQVSDFGKGPTLDDYVNALYPEGAGGPGIRESYELFAYFMNNHVQTPKAVSPFMLIMGDEMFYDKIEPAQVKHYTGDGLQEKIDSIDVWKQLAQKYDIYLLRKAYPGHDDKILDQWGKAIGEQKIIPLYDPLRVVDVAMGLIAKKWGKYSDFGKNLSSRQDEKGIAVVEASLRLAPGLDVKDMKSTTKGSKTSKKSKNLLEG